MTAAYTLLGTELQITLPAASVSHTWAVSAMVIQSTVHPNRFEIYLDSSNVWPLSTGNGLMTCSDKDGANYVVVFSCVPVVVPGDGNTHTLSIYVNPADSTNAVTWYDRFITAMRII
jgi:hypothetical protein